MGKKTNKQFVLIMSVMCIVLAVLLYLAIRLTGHINNTEKLNKMEAKESDRNEPDHLMDSVSAKDTEKKVLDPDMVSTVDHNRDTSVETEQTSKVEETTGQDRDENPLEKIKRLIAPVEPGDVNENYMIRVFKDIQVVAVFTDNGNGKYDQFLHAFTCSTADEDHETPNGKTQIGVKYHSAFMIDASYGQYSSEFLQYHYFHGVPSYHGETEAGVSWEDFNKLGSPASHGCIRLQSKDAKWIFTYCEEGTPVEVLEESSGFPMVPTVVERVMMKESGPSWDPTNDNPLNPYQQDPSLLLP